MPNGWPWNTIGQVFVWDKNLVTNKRPDHIATATLVGPRHVLTCKHALRSITPNWRIQFIPAFFDGQSVLGPGAQSYVSHMVLLHGSSPRAAHDVAVFRLYDPLGNQAGWLDVLDMNTSSPQWDGSANWWKVGYPWDVAGGLRPSSQSNINIIHAEPDGTSLELRHDGDVEAGASGAPLFFWFQPGGQGTALVPLVVGVTSGGREDTVTGEKYSMDAGGWPLHSVVTFARSHWP